MPARSRRRDAQRELDELEEVFACLAHASRRHVLLVLKHHGATMTAGEIANRFACSWPTTSRHLQKLEHAGLVVVEPQGRERVYRLDESRLTRVVGGWIREFS